VRPRTSTCKQLKKRSVVGKKSQKGLLAFMSLASTGCAKPSGRRHSCDEEVAMQDMWTMRQPCRIMGYVEGLTRV